MNEPRWSKITADTPIDEVQRIHKDIWQYVVENGEKPETPYLCNCVSCTCAMFNKRKHTSMPVIYCKFCPIEWPDGKVCYHPKSIYQAWIDSARGSQKSMDLAAEIRDISFKKENTYEQD